MEPRSARQNAPAEGQSASESEEQSTDDDQGEDQDGDQDDNANPTSNAYAELVHSLSSQVKHPDRINEPRGKKRKLCHQIARNADLPREGAAHVVEHYHGQAGGYGPPEVDSEADASRKEMDFEYLQVEEVLDLGVQSADEDPGLDESNESWYQLHFASPNDDELAMQKKRIENNQWVTQKLDVGPDRGVLQVPMQDSKTLLPQTTTSTRDLQLKARLIDNAHKSIGSFDRLEQAIVPSIFMYRDVLFGGRMVQNASRLREITCLHALNHILLTRDRVLKNNAKLAAASETENTEYRDQGFTRPKILFLLETRQACVRILDAMTRLYSFEQQENKKRFLDSFSQPEDKYSEDKPADFRELFEGNDDNEFRVGIKLTRKTLKIFSPFYSSDIIFASTLGLRRAIESDNPKKSDYDFLSSIEMVVMDQADATLMQNWEHAEFVFQHLNLQPKDAHGCDFSRVRSWYLDGYAPNLRQTIVLAAYLTPKINTLYNKHMLNVTGRLKYTPNYASGLIESLPFAVKQTFLRFDSPSHITDPDSRFKYFNTSILPLVNRLPRPLEGGLGVLVFIPSYLDFVRVRNSLVDSDFSFASISEYTDQTDVRKARSHFMNGKHSLLLYTGRAHHFHRYNIRGVKKVVFYGVPENPTFYGEIVDFIGKSQARGEVSKAEAHVRVCFSKWEKLEMERIIGTKRISKFMGDKGDVFDFM